MIGMRVIEADNILAAVTPLALNAHEFLGIDVVPVVGRVRACVAAACGRGHDTCAVFVETSKQNSTAFVWIGLFAVAPDFGVIAWLDLQHRKTSSPQRHRGMGNSFSICLFSVSP